MRTRTVRLELVTPAFLGGADQSSEWRTPPIKAMLRQWWRVWAAAEFDSDWKTLREIEGVVFGHAALKHNGRAWHTRSPVSLRLRHTRPRPMHDWQPIGKVFHPEAGKGAGGMNVGADLYLGYGPLEYKGRTKLKAPPALDTGSSGDLLLRYPEKLAVDELTSVDVDAALSAALKLAHLFGTVGSRSRNGWGSLEILHEGAPLVPESAIQDLAQAHARPMAECVGLEWPHAIGTDQKGLLLWRTKRTFHSWGEAMKELARVKIAFRTPLDAGLDRLLLAYPVTHHTLTEWGNTSRLANQLRFKIHRTGDVGFQGWAFHLPCGLPEKLLQKLPGSMRRTLGPGGLGIWQKVHGVLDNEMERLA